MKKNTRNLRRKNGITLVALIITIIVMLILVAVTVSILINSNVIGKAKDATKSTQTAYENEANFGENLTITIDGQNYTSIDEATNKGSSYGLSNDETYFIGKLTDSTSRTQDGNVEYENGYKFSQGHFIKGEHDSKEVYFCWDVDTEETYGFVIDSQTDMYSVNIGFVDIYYPNGDFLTRLDTSS